LLVSRIVIIISVVIVVIVIVTVITRARLSVAVVAATCCDSDMISAATVCEDLLGGDVGVLAEAG